LEENEQDVLRRALSRERSARKEAEKFAEERTRELYTANERLKDLAENLQRMVDARTAEIRAAKEEAERANSAKTTFLATMSHEIRTPLNVILGMTDLVMDGHLSSEQRSLLRRVMANSETLLAIINDILDISRIEAGELRVNSERFDPREVVEDVAESLCVQAFDKRLHIVCDVGERVPRAVLGDGHRLRQILLNLGSNAVKFTSSGDVVISARSVAGDEGSARIEFRVVDSGPGIAPDQIEKVFQAFVRLDEHGPNRSIPGAGLGLTISRALATAMGGAVAVESMMGAGSSFIATIPFVEVEDAESESRKFPWPLRVALVHPHGPTRGVLRRILERAGASVVDSPSLESDDLPESSDGRFTWVVDSSDAALRHQSFQSSHRKLVLLRDVSLRANEVKKLTRAVAVIPAPFRADELCDGVELANGIGLQPRSLRPARLSSPTAPLLRPRVLVVEDSADNRRFFSLILESMEVRVECVDNGKAGLEIVKKGGFDLVLSDLQMPIMDGFDFVRAFREWEEANDAARTTVVALTADATAGVRQQCVAAGFDEYVTKPVSRATLEEIVERHVDRRPVILVVDDSVDQARLIHKWLSRANTFKFIHVSTGSDAIEVISDQVVSMVLIDVALPDLDGYETVRRIRGLDNGASMPIIAVAGLGERAAPKRSEDAGCTHFLGKPFRDDELIQTVKDAFRSIETEVAWSLSEPSDIRRTPDSSRTSPEGEVRVEVDPDVVDLLPGFFRNRWTNVRQLRSLVAENNFEDTKKVAHSEKGVGGTYGFPSLTDMMREVESACVHGELERLVEVLDRTESYLRSVEAVSPDGQSIRGAEFE
jgi:signal transduction histidine kinase/DNA-binding response OmpR family regulator